MFILIYAGAQGIGPWSAVLETAVLPLNDAPIFKQNDTRSLLPGHPGFFVRRTFLAPFAEFLKFQLSFHLLLVFDRIIVSSLANSAF